MYLYLKDQFDSQLALSSPSIPLSNQFIRFLSLAGFWVSWGSLSKLSFFTWCFRNSLHHALHQDSVWCLIQLELFRALFTFIQDLLGLLSIATSQATSFWKFLACGLIWSCRHKIFTFKVKPVVLLQVIVILPSFINLVLLLHSWTEIQIPCNCNSSCGFQWLLITLGYV